MEKASSEDQPVKIATVLGMIIGAATYGVDAFTGLHNNRLIELGTKETPLDKIVKRFEIAALGMGGGTTIIANLHIILENIQLANLDKELNRLQEEIEKKLNKLEENPQNQELKKELSTLKQTYSQLEETHFTIMMSVTAEMTKLPVTALQTACETLLKILPSNVKGIESALNVLTFLGGSIGVITAAAQIHKYKENIFKIHEIQNRLKEAVEHLEKNGASENTLKLLKESGFS